LLPESFFKLKPWEHQLTAINNTIDLPEYAFFFEVGAGKTLACVNALRVKYMQERRLMRTLILGPPIILENWKREIIANSNIPPKDIVVLYGTGKKRIEAMKRILDKPRIVITNYESLTMGAKKVKVGSKTKRIPGELFSTLMAWTPEVVVLDESHRCKDATTSRAIMATRISDVARYKFLLTGTPILNTMMDIFSQFRILDGGKTFGQNFFVFRGRYFVDKNSGMNSQKHFPNWVPKKGAADEINKLVRLKSMYVTKDECLDLPPLIKQTIHVPMSTAQAKAYESMRKHFIAYIDDKAAVAELALTKALRLQQIVSGFVNVEEGAGIRKPIVFKDNPRKQALKELLADITPKHKVLVWSVFKENYNDIREVCEKLRVNYVEVHGGIKNKQESVDRFCNEENVRVFIGHPGSGGIGITLIEASYMIFYSRNFSLEYDIQAEARCYRGGSEIHNKITRIDLVTPDTIDEAVVQSLQNKKHIGYSVLKEMVNGED